MDDEAGSQLTDGTIECLTSTTNGIRTPFKKSRLLELAEKIQAQVKDIQNYLNETEQPNPSFEGTAKKVEFSGVDDTRSACIESLTELQDLLLTPKELLHAQAVGILPLPSRPLLI